MSECPAFLRVCACVRVCVFLSAGCMYNVHACVLVRAFLYAGFVCMCVYVHDLSVYIHDFCFVRACF